MSRSGAALNPRISHNLDRTAQDQPFLIDERFRDAAGLVERIRLGERNSIETLCTLVRTQGRYQLARKVSRDFREDKFHDAVVTVLTAIRNGSLHRPERLSSFVYTITRRSVTAQIRANIRERRCTSLNDTASVPSQSISPEAEAARAQKQQQIVTVLATLCPRDRELLTRFYLDEQLPDQICAEMQLTPTQFRLYKSRALSRCARHAIADQSTKPERTA